MKKQMFYNTLLVIIILIVCLFPAQGSIEAANQNDEISRIEKLYNQSIKNKNWTNAAIYAKQLAVIYDQSGMYDQATKYYDLNAVYWEKAGHGDWGIVNSIRADHLRTTVEIYLGQQAKEKEHLEKFEPLSGTYTGMYVAEKRANGKVEAIEDIYGQKHAMFLTYAHWRRPYPESNSFFPLKFAEKAKQEGGALQVAWEPSYGLDDVLDDAYVRQFAREAKSTGIPIFIRFAGEMNGEWVPWYDDPKKYIEKFRLIHDIMEEEAPNVAMVWSPNFLPRHNIAPFYPGDAYVDWVGFSLYTIPYSHGKEVLGGNPIDYLRPLYAAYAHKPIMISEGAVSFYSYELEKDYTPWAVSQLGNMYAFLPRLFPQVKAITYFNLDKKTTNYDNRNNNYDLGDRVEMDQRYQEIIKNGHFLSKVETGATSDENLIYTPISIVTGITGKQKIFTYIKLPLGQQPTVVQLYEGDRLVAEAHKIPWDMEVDFSTLDETKDLQIVALDEHGNEMVRKSFQWVSK